MAKVLNEEQRQARRDEGRLRAQARRLVRKTAKDAEDAAIQTKYDELVAAEGGE